MRVVAVRPYSGPSTDGRVGVYDVTVAGTHSYLVGSGQGAVLASNSKRISLLDVNALLSHGAVRTLEDVNSVRGQANPEWWLQFMNGLTPTEPRVPRVYEKFVAQLKASGINVVPDGGQLQVMALTSKDVDQLAGDRVISNGNTVNFDKDLKPVVGGLFDPKLTGGHGGKNWSAIKLEEPMPSPVMEEPIRRLLGLTQKKYEAVLAGEETLPGHGTGAAAVKKALQSINVTRELGLARVQAKALRGQKRDDAVRRLDYLKRLDKLGMSPADWVLDRAPVLPPVFRPVSVMGSTGTPLVADANYLYKELIEANDVLKEMKAAVGEEGVGNERLALYRAFKAVTGLGEPVTLKSQEKKVKGLLKNVFGTSPKYGCYDDATEILTRHGWVRFPELQEGVEVATLNPATGAFEWQLPTAVQHHRYVGELIEIKAGKRYKSGDMGSRVDLLVTPNHRNWVRNRQKGLGDDRLEEGWVIEPAYQTAASGNRKWFRTAASAWHGHRRLPPFIGGDAASFAEFVGWWAAEGWVHSDGQSADICQERVANAGKCDQIEAVIARLGLPYASYDHDGRGANGDTRTRQWSIKSRELVEWLITHVGTGADSKHLSDEVRDWDRDLLESFFLGYMGGDGGKAEDRVLVDRKTHKHRSRLTDVFNRVHTTSKLLYEDLTEVCCKLGLTLHRNSGQPAEGRRAELFRGNASGQRFTQAEGYAGKGVRSYDGHVHCCTVQNGIVFVRRNGVPVFSGNSVQRKLISSTVDNVGRAVIAPNPDFDMDTVGIPEGKAFDVYEKFVARRLRRRGMPLTQALRAIKDRTELARDALLAEMEERPVYINRAPVLHRFGIMAFRPRLVKGDTMQISPLIVKGFNADFDGNCLDFDTELLLLLDQSLLQCSSDLELARWGELCMRLTGETLVQYLDGGGQVLRVKIGEFPRGDRASKTKRGQLVYPVPAGVQVVSYDHETGRPVVCPVTRFTVDRDHPCVTVTTSRGRTVTVSDNESLCVFDMESGALVKMRPADAIGKLLPYVKRDPLPGNKYDRDIGWLYGALISDGWASDRMVGYAKNEKAKRDEVVRIAREKIIDAFDVHEYRQDVEKGAGSSHKFASSVKIHLTGKHLVKRLLAFVHPDYDPSSDKRAALFKMIPADLLLNGSRECLLGLLAGLLDGDATLGWNTAQKKRRLVVKFNTSSPYLRDDICLLLRKLGVRCSVTVCPPRGVTKTAYVLCPSIVDMAGVFPDCRLIGENAQAVVSAFLADGRTLKDDIDIVPISSSLAAALMSYARGVDNSLYAILSAAKKSGSLTRASATRLLALVGDDDVHPHWAGFKAVVLGSDIHWEAVASVDDAGSRDVYDLEVPDTKVFAIASGLVIYDTMQFHVPSTDDAVREAYDRMLPSKNLLAPSDFKSPVHIPGQEYLGGLFHLTRAAAAGGKKRRGRVFRNKADALAAYARGDIRHDEPVRILE